MESVCLSYNNCIFSVTLPKNSSTSSASNAMMLGRANGITNTAFAGMEIPCVLFCFAFGVTWCLAEPTWELTKSCRTVRVTRAFDTSKLIVKYHRDMSSYLFLPNFFKFYVAFQFFFWRFCRGWCHLPSNELRWCPARW